MNVLLDGVKNFGRDEDGLQTLEIMLIIAVLVVIALAFRTHIIDWVEGLIDFGTSTINQFRSGN